MSRLSKWRRKYLRPTIVTIEQADMACRFYGEMLRGTGTPEDEIPGLVGSFREAAYIVVRSEQTQKADTQPFGPEYATNTRTRPRTFTDATSESDTESMTPPASMADSPNYSAGADASDTHDESGNVATVRARACEEVMA